MHYWGTFSHACMHVWCDVIYVFPLHVHPSGCGVNLGMRGLESMGTFIYRTATAVDQNDILEALSAKMQHSRQVAETFKHTGLAESMYEWKSPGECIMPSSGKWRWIVCVPNECLQWITSLELKWTSNDSILNEAEWAWAVNRWIMDVNMLP